MSAGLDLGGSGIQAVQARMQQLDAVFGARTATEVRASGAATGADFTGTLTSALATSGGGDPGAAAVSLARSYTGVPYRWGGTNPRTGLDCSGLVQLVYSQLGVQLPRTSQQQQHAGTEVASLDQARPGDLVFFGEPAHHVGIYIGGGKMIDAPHTGSTVGVHSLYGKPSHIRRVLPEAAPTGSSALTAAVGIGGGASGIRATAGGLSGPYAPLFTAAGRRYGVDPALLSAVAKAESGYRPRAVSAAGAQGLMQLMPGTARSLGVDPLSPEQAVDGAARLLARHLSTYSGRVDLALAAYNAGPGAVSRYGGVPPFSETRNYIRTVMSNWEALR